MGYERYPRGDDWRRSTRDDESFARDYGSGRDYTYSSAREYDAAGAFDRERRGRDQDRDLGPYGRREYGNRGYAQREQFGRGQPQGGRAEYRRGSEDNSYLGSYASDGHRWEDVGGNRDRDHDYGSGPRAWFDYGAHRDRGHDRGRTRPMSRRDVPRDYDYDDRGFLARAGDEVRSWFGDEEAERRREADMRYDERYYDAHGSSARDSDYGAWRRSQIAALDRDYDEYRRENRSRFESEFSTWRSGRQTQRDALGKVTEHMEVLGSDGTHVGTVDKVKGDRILLTKSDSDAGGRHHSIPSRWIASVADKVTLEKTADEAKRHWRDEEQNQAMFGDRSADADTTDAQGRILNRSFSGTY